ncbi:hypothetical protein ACQ4PT_002530 [Festuca glaucescens]
MAITGANMWALLLDKDPGHSAAAGDLAVDVVYWKLKKAAAAAAVKVEETPPARNVTKSVNSGEKPKKMKKIATGCSKQAASSAAIVHGGGKVNINGATGDNKQTTAADGEELTDMWIRRYLSQEETGKKEEGEFAVVAAGGGRRRTVAPRTRKASIAEGVTVPAGANMWDLLLDKDPGHSAVACDLAVDVVDRKRKVEETQPVPGNIAKTTKRGEKSKKNKEGAAGCSKNSPASAAVVRDGEEPMNGDIADNNQTAATDDEELTNILIRRYLSQEETSKKEEKEAMFAVVAGGRRRKVVPRTRQPAVAEGVTVTGANMWALLSDEDPGHGSTAVVDDRERKTVALAVPANIEIAEVEEAPLVDRVCLAPGGGAKPAKRVKKNKTKKNKKDAAGDSKQAATVVAPPSDEEEEISDAEEEEDMTGEVSAGGSRFWTVAWRVCRAAVSVALLALYFQVASPPVTAV